MVRARNSAWTSVVAWWALHRADDLRAGSGSRTVSLGPQRREGWGGKWVSVPHRLTPVRLPQLLWLEMFFLVDMKAASPAQRMFSVTLIVLCALGLILRGRLV